MAQVLPPPPRRRGSVAPPFLLLSAVVLSACRDARQPLGAPEPVSVPPASAAAVTEVYRTDGDSTWNYYSADVQVTLADQDQNGYTGPEDFRNAAYTIERRLGSDNVWQNVTTFDSYLTQGLAGAGQPGLDVARIEGNELGSSTRIYNRQGALITADTTLLDRLGVKAADTIPHPPSGFGAKAAGAMHVGAAAAARRSPVELRGWLDEIVITPRARARLGARRAARLGGPIGRLRGLDRFVNRSRFRGRDRISEMLVDPAIGGVAERNEMVDGQLVMRALYGYTKVNDSTFVRTSIRFETARPANPTNPLVVEYRVSNIRVERREGGN